MTAGRALSGRSVDAVVRVLVAAGRPLTAAEVAPQVGLTARYAQQLLAAAEQAGRVEVVSERTELQGRLGRATHLYWIKPEPARHTHRVGSWPCDCCGWGQSG